MKATKQSFRSFFKFIMIGVLTASLFSCSSDNDNANGGFINSGLCTDQFGQQYQCNTSVCTDQFGQQYQCNNGNINPGQNWINGGQAISADQLRSQISALAISSGTAVGSSFRVQNGFYNDVHEVVNVTNSEVDVDVYDTSSGDLVESYYLDQTDLLDEIFGEGRDFNSIARPRTIRVGNNFVQAWEIIENNVTQLGPITIGTGGKVTIVSFDPSIPLFANPLLIQGFSTSRQVLQINGQQVFF